MVSEVRDLHDSTDRGNVVSGTDFEGSDVDRQRPMTRVHKA